jgi:integrase/recombinase XerD
MSKKLATEWITWLTEVRRLRGATLDAYGRTITVFVETHDIKKVTADDVEAFMRRPRSRNGVGSPATQDRDRVVVSQFYEWLVARGHVKQNPCLNVGVPKVRNRQPKAVDDDVWVTLWSSDLHREDRVWLGLAAFAGLRRREIVSVTPQNFDLQSFSIQHMMRKGGSTSAVEYGEMARTIADVLPHLLPDPDAWLADVEWLVNNRIERKAAILVPFNKPASELTRFRMSLDDENAPDPAVINKRLRRLLSRSGLSETAFSPHALRHTCATNLMRCGVPLEITADLLSHSSIETTRRYLQTAGALHQWRTRR